MERDKSHRGSELTDASVTSATVRRATATVLKYLDGSIRVQIVTDDGATFAINVGDDDPEIKEAIERFAGWRFPVKGATQKGGSA